ncbi:fimbrial protein [Pseudenterobacter timonensis]|uniref:Fimbrial protein n=1 Tax=Pseudenterobacter timonensis TaxID=1755099 RepID=A0AAE4IV65_9ENTR|nr:fimbrial protein [Pseudenterobacter timonensis]MDR9891638.1 fimbrial protein [Pseudenterobacter timonensis]
MKKNLIVAVLAATSALTMSNAFAAAGIVNFNGEILDAACTVDVSSQNQTVVLGSYHKSEFSTAGDKTAAKKFDIILKDCPTSVIAAKVRFDGQPEMSNENLLSIDTSLPGAATGVAINLMTADKSNLPLHGENAYSYALSSTQDNTLHFYAQYQATAVPVQAGPANSVASFSVIYN